MDDAEEIIDETLAIILAGAVVKTTIPVAALLFQHLPCWGSLLWRVPNYDAI